jgi:NAD(P)H-dependent FMN reductase
MTDHITRVAVLVGSLRADSLNRKVAELIRDRAHTVVEGVELDIVDGLDQLPFYEETLDAENTPAAATAVRERVAAADAVLVVTPEYNGTMPAVLNNAIDWLSRPYGAGAIVGKPVGVTGTTPTPYGGKWAHEDTVRSVGIAGGIAVDGAVHSQSVIEVDPLTDPEVLERFLGVLRAVAQHATAAAA